MENYGGGMGGGGGLLSGVVANWSLIINLLFLFVKESMWNMGGGQVCLISAIGVSLLVVYEVQYD